MKKAIKFSIPLFLIALICSCSARKTAENYTNSWRYEIEPVDIGTGGSYLIKVWSYSKQQAVATEQAKKNAIHGVIFRGFNGVGRVAKQPPLARNPNLLNEKKEFFDGFFANGGDYMRYVSITNDGSIAAKDRLRVGKEYKIGTIVSVDVDGLRKNLENARIISKLGAGFAP